MSLVERLARPEILALEPYSHASWDPMLERLHAYSGRLAAAETTEQILDILGSQLESMTGATAVIR